MRVKKSNGRIIEVPTRSEHFAGSWKSVDFSQFTVQKVLNGSRNFLEPFETLLCEDQEKSTLFQDYCKII
jgi:hypothetical protein